MIIIDTINRHKSVNANTACLYDSNPKWIKFIPKKPDKNDNGMKIAEKIVNVVMILFIFVD